VVIRKQYKRLSTACCTNDRITGSRGTGWADRCLIITRHVEQSSNRRLMMVGQPITLRAICTSALWSILARSLMSADRCRRLHSPLSALMECLPRPSATSAHAPAFLQRPASPAGRRLPRSVAGRSLAWGRLRAWRAVGSGCALADFRLNSGFGQALDARGGDDAPGAGLLRPQHINDWALRFSYVPGLRAINLILGRLCSFTRVAD
jgi:hypothetical protein